MAVKPAMMIKPPTAKATVVLGVRDSMKPLAASKPGV
jgi:hypothetical protein